MRKVRTGGFQSFALACKEDFGFFILLGAEGELRKVFSESSRERPFENFMNDLELNLPGANDPFAEAERGDDVLTKGLVHIRLQQRNGRKSLTTVQGYVDSAALSSVGGWVVEGFGVSLA